MTRHGSLIAVLLFASAWQAHAVHFTSSQTGPTTWKYDITFDPFDNYSIFQTNTTITLTGLSGVTGAAGPVTLLLIFLGLACAGGYQMRYRLKERFQSRS